MKPVLQPPISHATHYSRIYTWMREYLLSKPVRTQACNKQTVLIYLGRCFICRIRTKLTNFRAVSFTRKMLCVPTVVTRRMALSLSPHKTHELAIRSVEHFTVVGLCLPQKCMGVVGLKMGENSMWSVFRQRKGSSASGQSWNSLGHDAISTTCQSPPCISNVCHVMLLLD